MKQQVLFIQGGGEGGYEADVELVDSLKTALGNAYHVDYPKLKSDESASDFSWPQQIGVKIKEAQDHVILAAHSLGASMLLKYLSENFVDKPIKGIFLIATPFWSGSEDWKAGLKLQDDFADRLSQGVPMYFYHCQDDEEIPVSHFDMYRQKVKWATFRKIDIGGHQLNNDLTLVAQDIKSI